MTAFRKYTRNINEKFNSQIHITLTFTHIRMPVAVLFFEVFSSWVADTIIPYHQKYEYVSIHTNYKMILRKFIVLLRDELWPMLHVEQLTKNPAR
jgi:hypothetical protein